MVTILIARMNQRLLLAHSPKNAGQIPGKELQRAMNNLRKSLGPAIVDLIVTDLEKQDIIFSAGSYSMKQLEDALKKTFGQDGGQLLVNKIRKALDKP